MNKGQKMIIFAVVVSFLMIIHILIVSATVVNPRITAIKSVPSYKILSTAEKYNYRLNIEYPYKSIPEITYLLKDTGIDEPNLKTLYFDGNLVINTSDIMILQNNGTLKVSALSSDTIYVLQSLEPIKKRTTDNYICLVRVETVLASIETLQGYTLFTLIGGIITIAITLIFLRTREDIIVKKRR